MNLVTTEEFCIRPAQNRDLPALHAVIQRAYRGQDARAGWTHEADLLEEERITLDALGAILHDPASLLVIAERRGVPIGSIQLTDKGQSEIYLSLLSVDPGVQAGGLGRQLLSAAENIARDNFSATLTTMTVIDSRTELIAYYVRRGYQETAWRLDFVVPRDPPLFMTKLQKRLD